MTELEAAIAAEIDECEYEEVEVSPIDTATICAIHGCDWDDDEAIPCWERRRMTAALSRMWDAAISAAADRLDGLFDSEWDRIEEKEGVVLTEDGRYCDGIAVAEDAVRALLSAGGNQ